MERIGNQDGEIIPHEFLDRSVDAFVSNQAQPRVLVPLHTGTIAPNLGTEWQDLRSVM